MHVELLRFFAELCLKEDRLETAKMANDAADELERLRDQVEEYQARENLTLELLRRLLVERDELREELREEEARFYD